MAEQIDLTCCEPSEPTNPKTDLSYRRRSGKVNHLFRLTNPIPQEMKDPAELKKVFANWNFVPFAGTNLHTSHSTLDWLNMLYKMSPTHFAAVNKKVKFAVGGKARVIRSVDPEFEFGEQVEIVQPAEAKMYADALKTFIEFEGGISKFHTRLTTQYEVNGNGFIELSFSTVRNQTRFSLRSHRTTNCMYLNTPPGDDRAVAISPVWTEEYLNKNHPRVVPMFPVWTNDGGVYRTMFHLKHGDNSWYGRPPSEGANVYMYREVQDETYQVRASASDYTGQMIFEVEDDNPQFAPAIDDKKAIADNGGGGKKFIDQLERNFTNKGDDPHSIFYASRPYGAKQMFVFQVSPNTKESWYKETGKLSADFILRAHGVTPRFLGFDVSNGFATDVYVADYVMYVEPVISELHNEIMNFVNSIITQVWNLVEQPQWNEYSLAFASPIQTTVDQFKSGQLAATKQTNSTDTPDGGVQQEQPNEPDPNAKKKPDPNADDNDDDK